MSKVKVAVNGFGRIGRCITRALIESHRNDIEICVINGGCGDMDSHIHLLKYDSSHGTLPGVHKIDDNSLDFGRGLVPIILEKDVTKIDWRNFGADIILECTGAFTKKEKALMHIDNAGAKKVIVSAPCTDADATIVPGVNDHILAASQKVVSIGSCTTNCLAPVAHVLNSEIGIKQGFMTTVHAYTNDQNVLDAKHKDKRRARACGLSMIPSSTGAAKALGLVIPELDGKIDGVAIRVPTPNVSIVDLTFTAARETSVEEINAIMRKAAQGKLAEVLGICEEELVSIDFNHNPKSSIFDITQTKVVNGTLCRVAAWYDNEWGFSNRMLDIAAIFGNL